MANIVNRSLITIALVATGIAFTACGQGGPGTLDFGGGGYDPVPHNGGGYDSVPHSTLDGPVTSSGGPTTGVDAGKTPTTPVQPVDAGNQTPANCPTCGAYSCTGSGGTNTVTLTPAANNACTTPLGTSTVTIACGNQINDATGKPVGAWSTAGGSGKLTVAIQNGDTTEQVSCTKQ